MMRYFLRIIVLQGGLTFILFYIEWGGANGQ